MITDWFVDLWISLSDWASGLLPTYDTAQIDEKLGAFDTITDLNYYLPIAELSALVFGIFALTPAFLATTLVLWLVALVRGGSSRG